MAWRELTASAYVSFVDGNGDRMRHRPPTVPVQWSNASGLASTSDPSLSEGEGEHLRVLKLRVGLRDVQSICLRDVLCDR
jgi:hypothetical protein